MTDFRKCTSCANLTKAYGRWYCTHYKLHLEWIKQLFHPDRLFYKSWQFTRCTHYHNKYDEVI